MACKHTKYPTGQRPHLLGLIMHKHYSVRFSGPGFDGSDWSCVQPSRHWCIAQTLRENSPFPSLKTDQDWRETRESKSVWVAGVLCFYSSISHRPCCPANFFVGPVDGMPTAPPEDAPACVQRLSAYRLRCLRRFHLKHDPQTLLAEEAQGQGCCMFLNTGRSDRDQGIQRNTLNTC